MENQESQIGPIRRIFRSLWGIAKAYFLTIGILVTLLPILTMWLVLRLGDLPGGKEAPLSLPDNFVLAIDADGMIATEQSESSSWLFRQLFRSGSDVSLNVNRAALRAAAKDERVKGVIFRINSLNGRLTDFFELRRIIEKYKSETKRPVYVALASADNSEYLLASVADRIALSPAGGLDIPGPVLQLTYFAEALKKLGVEFEVYQAGKYKSAFEPFVRQSPSDESMEIFQGLESSMRQVLVQLVAAGRNKPVEQVAGWFKQSIFIPKDAVDAGVVDVIAHPNDFTAEFFAAIQVSEEISSEDYFELENLSSRNDLSGPGLGVVYALGEVMMTATDDYEDQIVPTRMQEELEWMAENEDVSAVVLRIDSPGGSATASELIWQHVQKLAAQKPVIVSMGSVAASGGYYIAAPATKIIAEPSTITGSIGVISAIPKTPGLTEKWGLSFTTITQSDRKAMFDPGMPLTPFDRALMESNIAAIYGLFKERVSTGRKIPLETVEQLAQGKVYSGVQALDAGLVDDLGGVTEAFQLAKQLGSLDPEKLYPVYRYEGEGIDLSSCLKSPMHLLRCMDKMQSRVGMSLFESVVPVDAHQLRTPKQLNALSKQDRFLTFGAYGRWNLP
jgi:protease-4